MKKVTFEVDGKKRTVGIKRFYNTNDYSFWMGHYAHEKKREGVDGFVKKYKGNLLKEKRITIKNCYLAAYIEWLTGEVCKDFDRFTLKKLVLSPYASAMYFSTKEARYFELEKAIPVFLRHNLLITEVHEAVPTPPPGMDLFTGK